MTKMALISQRSNFAADFGTVLRASAIFYYKRSGDFLTTISLLHYWRLKRDISVAVVASVRDMTGTLLKRELLKFENGAVINYRPDLDEGSVEIEAFGTESLMIPYAGVMGIYEKRGRISMVHSYGRTYSPHEVEEGRCLSRGEEGCWTIRDNDVTRSFCVFHNGGNFQATQTATLRLVRRDGQRKVVPFAIPRLMPFQTVKLYPSDIVPDLRNWLNGEGSAALSFEVSQAFTRMLVGNETDSDIQLTHSNFNFSIHRTDQCDIDTIGYMWIPRFWSKKSVIVYPDASTGDYSISYGGKIIAFRPGTPTAFPVESGVVQIRRIDGPLPTRIVTGLVHHADELPSECSLGVITKLQPPKRLWWALCRSSSRLVIHDMPEVYGDAPEEATLSVSLYSAISHAKIQRTFPIADLSEFTCGVHVGRIFESAEQFLAADFGFLTVFSEYAGLACYTTIEPEVGGISFEHGF
jgi:hypothetical protein